MLSLKIVLSVSDVAFPLKLASIVFLSITKSAAKSELLSFTVKSRIAVVSAVFIALKDTCVPVPNNSRPPISVLMSFAQTRDAFLTEKGARNFISGGRLSKSAAHKLTLGPISPLKEMSMFLILAGNELIAPLTVSRLSLSLVLMSFRDSSSCVIPKHRLRLRRFLGERMCQG